VFHRHNIFDRIETVGEAALYFSEDLYKEHLEEVAFLYVNRLYLLSEYKGSWKDIAKIESKIQGHIEALFMGDDLALDVCRQMRNDANQGIFYAAVRVFCRHKKDDWVKEMINGLDPVNTDRTHAVIDALNHDLPVEWHPMIEQMLLSAHPFLMRMALAVIGYRRIPMDEPLIDFLYKPHDETFGLIIRTLGRLRVQSARDYLLFLFKNGREEEAIKQELCMALLRLQENSVVHVPADNSELAPWVYQAMGLCGGAPHALYLNTLSLTVGVCEESLLALGFLGYVSSVDILIAHLNEGPYSEMASLSLHLITGADLSEDVFIPDPINENALFPHELEKLRKGEPLYAPGKEPGITVNRVSQNPLAWKSWWLAHKSGFDIQTPYRYGKPCSPSGVLKTLESETNPAFIRQLAYEELVIRYDQDFCFDVTFPVAQQQTSLNRYRKWVEEYGRKSGNLSR